MNKLSRAASLAIVVALVVLSGLPAQADPGKSKSKKAKASITIVNKSKWEIHHLYLTPADSKSWGPDQLGKHVIGRGESYTLSDIDCDLYDIMVVDEDKDECVVEDIDFCIDDEKWVITDKDLLKCQARS